MRWLLALSIAMVGAACQGELPLVIRDEMTVTSKAKPGAATVVFFTDFQCPYCRKTHAALDPVLEPRRTRVRVVLRHVPLPRHPDARTAARAMVCVERLTPMLADDYARALFASPDLSEAACEGLATERGVEVTAYQRCLSSPSTDARIEQDLAMFDAVRGDGVPLLFVGRTRLEGSQTSRDLAAALDDAIAGK